MVRSRVLTARHALLRARISEGSGVELGLDGPASGWQGSIRRVGPAHQAAFSGTHPTDLPPKDSDSTIKWKYHGHQIHEGFHPNSRAYASVAIVRGNLLSISDRKRCKQRYVTRFAVADPEPRSQLRRYNPCGGGKLQSNAGVRCICDSHVISFYAATALMTAKLMMIAPVSAVPAAGLLLHT